MHYRLVAPTDQAVASILRETLKHLKNKAEMRRDIRDSAPPATLHRSTSSSKRHRNQLFFQTHRGHRAPS